MSFGFGFGMAKAAAFLSGPVPSLNLQFAGATTLDPRITFTRASSATYFDSAGVLRRATYNLLTYSEQFDNAAYTKLNCSVSANTTVSPDGNITADTLVENTANAIHRLLVTATVTSGQAYTLSVYAKNNGRFLYLNCNALFAARATFDLSNGTVAATGAGSAAITSVGNGWFRCSITGTAAASVTDAFYIQLNNSGVASDTTYTGNGNSGIYLWGAQLEQASTAGPYYATTTAANGAPRFDYNPTTLAPRGLLIEEQRTNLLTYSEQFDNAAWGKTRSSISANATIAPDGALTADKLVEDTQTGGHLIDQSVAGIADSTTVTASVFAKAAERQWITIAVIGKDTSINRRWFNLSNGTAGSTDGTLVSSSITSVGNGWYRLTVVASVATGAGTPAVRINLGTADATPSYTGDGTSGIYIWGAQLEAGSFATSYIPTVAAQVTRSADSASMTGTNFSSWYNGNAGTVQAEFVCGFQGSATQSTASYGIWGITNPGLGSFNGYGARLVGNSNFSDNINAVSRYAPASQNNQINIGQNAFLNLGQTYKVAFGWDASGIAGTSAGQGSVQTAANSAFANNSGVTQLSLGNQNIGGSGPYQLNGWIRKLTFYPTRLANATLQALTT